MQPIAQSFTDEDITALEDWCERLNEHMPQVAPDWVDGYLTALVCGPRAVTPTPTARDCGAHDGGAAELLLWC